MAHRIMKRLHGKRKKISLRNDMARYRHIKSVKRKYYLLRARQMAKAGAHARDYAKRAGKTSLAWVTDMTEASEMYKDAATFYVRAKKQRLASHMRKHSERLRNEIKSHESFVTRWKSVK